MSWTRVTFGKHKGKTLPQIVFADPDWFFWAIENGAFKNKGSLEAEASDVYRKATRIRIPSDPSGPMVAEYWMDLSSGKFSHMQIVPADRPAHDGASPTRRLEVINLAAPRALAAYDKLGGRNMVRSAKYALFGDSKARMTKQRCESFFSDPNNFA